MSKREKAVALGYHKVDGDAPKVLAAGKGLTARQIREIAKKHGIPLIFDPALAELLAELRIGEEIPPELYEAAARILAFVYSLEEAQSVRTD